jgi:hypothetical protein
MSLKRILAVTAGLAATGAIVGTVLGASALTAWILIRSGDLRGAGGIIGIAALTGAAIGAVIAPIFAWTLLRTVPLGRAILGTAIGTLLGVAVGPLIHASGLFAGPIAGFILAAVGLRLTATRGKSKRIAEESTP